MSGLDHTDSAAQVSSGYSELGDGQVMEVLSKHLRRFHSFPVDGEPSSSSSPACSDIVLYREAIEHCARLYRVMVRRTQSRAVASGAKSHFLLFPVEFAWGKCTVARSEGKWQEVSSETHGLHKAIKGAVVGYTLAPL